jgi:uncharacterized membrane protein YhaH (DUF805 family)
MHWIVEPLRRYADFSGRSRRREALGFMLALAVLFVLWLVALVASGVSNFDGKNVVSLIVLFFGGTLFWLAMIVPTLAVTVRRFHDQGLSGWFTLFHLLPYIGSFVVLVFMFIQGKDGPNQYGPDPRGNDADHYQRVFGDPSRLQTRVPETY